MFNKEELRKIYNNAEQKYIEKKYKHWIDEMKFAAMNRRNYVQYYNSENALPREWVKWLWRHRFSFYGLDESKEFPVWRTISDLNVELDAYRTVRIEW